LIFKKFINQNNNRKKLERSAMKNESVLCIGCIALSIIMMIIAKISCQYARDTVTEIEISLAESGISERHYPNNTTTTIIRINIVERILIITGIFIILISVSVIIYQRLEQLRTKRLE